MITVCIIGAGDLGGAAADALARRGQVDRVILVDQRLNAAAGKALDIQQSGSIDVFHTRLEGTDDVSRVVGCSACIVADRFAIGPAEWHGQEGLSMLRRLLPDTGAAPIVFGGVHQADLLRDTVRELHAPRERILGSAPEAFAAAIVAMVAMEAHCSPAEIALTVLGPPAGFVVPWSQASIGGYALERVLTPVQLSRLEARAARLWPPGPFVLGLAAARVAEAAVLSARRACTALTVLAGEFGVRGRVGALPVILSPVGVVHARVPVLNTRERVKVETALGRQDAAGAVL